MRMKSAVDFSLGAKFILVLERPANKSQVEISGFGSSEKGNTKSSR